MRARVQTSALRCRPLPVQLRAAPDSQFPSGPLPPESGQALPVCTSEIDSQHSAASRSPYLVRPVSRIASWAAVSADTMRRDKDHSARGFFAANDALALLNVHSLRRPPEAFR